MQGAVQRDQQFADVLYVGQLVLSAREAPAPPAQLRNAAQLPCDGCRRWSGGGGTLAGSRCRFPITATPIEPAFPAATTASRPACPAAAAACSQPASHLPRPAFAAACQRTAAVLSAAADYLPSSHTGATTQLTAKVNAAAVHATPPTTAAAAAAAAAEHAFSMQRHRQADTHPLCRPHPADPRLAAAATVPTSPASLQTGELPDGRVPVFPSPLGGAAKGIPHYIGVLHHAVFGGSFSKLCLYNNL